MKTRILLSLVLIVGVLGCTGPGCATITPGNDPVVVNAERIELSALYTADGFIEYEAANQAIIESKAPAIHSLAEKIRTDFPPALIAARKATKQYKASGLPADASVEQKAITAALALAAQAAQGFLDAQVVAH